MEKLSSEDIQEVLADVPEVLRALVRENRDQKEKLAGYERKEHAAKIAGIMEERGLDPATSYRQKIAELLADPDRDLAVTEEAVRMDVPNVKLASVSDEQPGNGANQLEAFILGG